MRQLLFAVLFSIMLLLGSAGFNNANAAAAQTSISLDMPVEKSFPVTQGETITFSGRLIRATNLAGISNVTVNIVQQVSFGESKHLVSGQTDSDGYYAIPWVVDVELLAGISGGSFGTETTQGRENRFQVVVVARFDGNDQYSHAVSTAQSFEVRLNALTIQVEKKSTYLAYENAAVTVYVRDINGLLVDPDKITSRFDSNPITLVKQDTGAYIFSAVALSPGSHQLQVIVEKRGHTSDDELITLDAMKRKTAISIATDKTSYRLGDTIRITASLVDTSGNTGVAGRTVSGALTTPTLQVRTLTFVDGKASYTLANTDAVGTWTLSAGFPGDQSYFGTNAQKTFSVTREGVITPPIEVPLEMVSLSSVLFKDQQGERLQEVTVGQAVMIEAGVTSNFETTEEVTYISQVKNADGITVALSWITSTLASGQELELAVSWTPEESGEYTAEIFVWKSVKDPQPYAEIKRSKISVE
ncbi:MAG: hypothetical protein ACRD3Z_03730 [Nitrososphaerales archaeon]